MKTKSKYIVTHINPDQDGVCAVWLLKRFRTGWEDAEVLFVPAGDTIFSYQKDCPDSYTYLTDLSKADIIHVDTGLGEFDHHQDDLDTCAAKLVFEWLVANAKSSVKQFNKEVLNRIVAVVNDIDHFREVYYIDPQNDRYDFMLFQLLDGLKMVYNGEGSGSEQILSFGLTAFDGLYRVFLGKLNAEKALEKGPDISVKTKYGKAIGFETSIDDILHLAQKAGYPIVVRKDPKKGYVRIKALPEKQIDLTPVYNRLIKKDPKARWFLHSGKTMLLNGDKKRPNMEASALQLQEIMHILKSTLS